MLTSEQSSKTHFFSPFFYDCLTTARTGETANDDRMSAAHLRAKNWTKGVNLFEKDYIIFPINKHQHWFLAIICFPRLSGPVAYDTKQPVKQPVKPVKYVKKKVADQKNVPLQVGSTIITPVLKRIHDSIHLRDDIEKDEAKGDESDAHIDDAPIDEVDPS